MHNKIGLKLAVFTLFSVLTPTLSVAAPIIMLEKGQTFTIGNQIKGFQIPTTDSAGVVKYYDMTVTLTAKPDGSLSPTADVVSTLSPSIKTRAVVAGTYLSSDGGTTCNVTNLTLTNGRIQSFFVCTGKNGVTGLVDTGEFSVASGSFTATHPFYGNLTIFGLSKRPDVNTQVWGVLTNGIFNVGACSNIHDLGMAMGVKTNGSQLVVSVYSWQNPTVFACSSVFNKQP